LRKCVPNTGRADHPNAYQISQLKLTRSTKVYPAPVRILRQY